MSIISKQKIKINSKNIILGDSNTRNAINDKIFINFKNFSQGGESYLYAYTKLKLITETNKIDTIILAFAPHNIISNHWIDGTEVGNLKYRMSEYFPYYTKQQHAELFFGNPKSYISSWQYLWGAWLNKKFYSQSSKDKLFFLGGYLENKKIQNPKNFTKIDYEPAKITDIEVKYLNKIIELCKSKKIKLIFINTPKNYSRQDFKNYYRQEFYDFYNTHYKDIPYLDFYNLPMPKDSYADISHLSYIGAEYFSKFLEKNNIGVLIKDSKYNRQLRINK